MEEETNKTGNASSGKSNESLKDTLKSGSPDEVRDRVKNVVEKGVAAVAGALKGFNKETERSDIPGETKSAIRQAAETTKTTVSSVTDEVSGLREPLKEAGQKLSETAKEVSSTVREQVDETRSAVKGGSSSASGSSSLRSGSMGMGGSELGTSGGSTGQGTELPDISRTPLAQPDEKLRGKDLSSESDE